MSDANKHSLKMAIIKSHLTDAGWANGQITLDNDVYFSSTLGNVGSAAGLDDLIVDFTGTSRRLSGLDGNDVLVGGAGGDTLSGGNGTDTAAYVNATSGITLYMDEATSAATSNVSNQGDARGDVLSSIEFVVGSAYGDFIKGTSGNERLWGWDGDDTLVGGRGIDKLFGGDGNDFLFAEDGVATSPTTSLFREELHGENGNDTLFAGSNRDLLDGGSEVAILIGDVSFAGDVASYVNSNAAVSINLATGQASGGHAQGDTLVDIEAVSGSRFADALTGNGERNILEGGGGNDAPGGGDVDIFWFSFDSIEGTPVSFGHDTITDWQLGTDAIHLDGITNLDLVNVTQLGEDTLVNFDGFDGSIRVLNTDAALFEAEVFI